MIRFGCPKCGCGFQWKTYHAQEDRVSIRCQECGYDRWLAKEEPLSLKGWLSVIALLLAVGTIVACCVIKSRTMP